MWKFAAKSIKFLLIFVKFITAIVSGSRPAKVSTGLFHFSKFFILKNEKNQFEKKNAIEKPDQENFDLDQYYVHFLWLFFQSHRDSLKGQSRASSLTRFSKHANFEILVHWRGNPRMTREVLWWCLHLRGCCLIVWLTGKISWNHQRRGCWSFGTIQTDWETIPKCWMGLWVGMS